MGQGTECCVASGLPVEVTYGDDQIPIVFTVIKKSNKQPIPFDTATEITTNYLESDGETVLTHTLTGDQITLVDGGFSGSFQDVLSEDEIKTLNPGNGSIIISYTIGGITKTLELVGAITVIKPSFTPG